MRERRNWSCSVRKMKNDLAKHLNEITMNIGLISDINFLENSKDLTVFQFSTAPSEIIEEIEKREIDLFFIYLNYLPQGTKKPIGRAQNAGIEALKRLRLKHYTQHCVLCSPLSREQLLLNDPSYLILYAPGISYWQIPFDPWKIDAKDLAQLPQLTTNLSAYFKGEYHLPDDRHFFANWWGVYTLWQLQKAVEASQFEPEHTPIEQTEKEFFAGMDQVWEQYNSINGLIAQYLNPIEQDNIINQLNALQELKEAKKLLEERIDTQSLSTEKLNEEEKIIEKIRNEIEKKIQEIIQEKKDTDNKHFEILEDVIKELKNEITGKLSIIEYNEKRKDIEKNIEEKIKEFISGKKINEIKNIRNAFQKKSPKIIYVDDKANDGWAKILQKIIYGKENENFKTVIPDKNIKDEDNFIAKVISDIEKAKTELDVIIKKEEELFKERQERNKNNQEKSKEKKEKYLKPAVLLILDLRLRGEEGNIAFYNISGIKVLKKLKENHFPCPVLITTASNKWTSYNRIINLGALAYWQKKGLDEQNDKDSLINNYMELIKAVYYLAIENEHIRFLYTEFIPLYKQYSKNKDIYWWETAFWKNEEIIGKRNNKDDNSSIEWKVYKDNDKVYKIEGVEKNRNTINITIDGEDKIEVKVGDLTKALKKGGMIVKRERIFNIIEQTIENYIDYIQNKVIQKGYKDIPKYDNSIILGYMYGVFEMIYDTQYVKSFSVDGFKFRYMTPIKLYLYDDIIEMRNKAVHQKNISVIDLSKFIRAVFELLKNDKHWKFAAILPDNEGKISAIDNERNIIKIESKVLKQYNIIIGKSTFINNNKDNKLFENKKLEELIGREVSFVIDTKIDSEDKRCIYLKSATLI